MIFRSFGNELSQVVKLLDVCCKWFLRTCKSTEGIVEILDQKVFFLLGDKSTGRVIGKMSLDPLEAFPRGQKEKSSTG